jgi:hypothetical protein
MKMIRRAVEAARVAANPAAVPVTRAALRQEPPNNGSDFVGGDAPSDAAQCVIRALFEKGDLGGYEGFLLFAKRLFQQDAV